MAKDIPVEDLLRMKGTLDAQRDVLDNTYESCLFYYLPEYQSESEYTTELSEEFQPLDVGGQRASSTLASGIFSNTISLDREFFSFRASKEELNDDDEVKRWLSDAAKTCLNRMQTSNYNMMAYESLLYYCVLNTAVMYTEYSDGRLVYQAFPITQCSIAESKDGIVDTLFRGFKMTAQQAYDKWGDNCSEKVLNDYNDPSKRFTEHDFFHAVFPRHDRDIESKHKSEMPFCSYYVDVDSKEIVEDGGYNSFPYAVPRFTRTSTTPYGRGPSFSCLTIAREIDRLSADIVDGIELKLNPPIFLPAGTVQSEVDLAPGAVNFYNAQQGNIVFYQVNIDVDKAEQRVAGLKRDMDSMFYVDLFLSNVDMKNMTATEVQARQGEKAQKINPVSNRLGDEFFSPSISRTLELLVTNQEIPAPPEVLAGEEFKVQYATRLTTMMKSIEVDSAMRSVAQASQLYLAKGETPELGYSINIDKLVKDLLDANNVNNDVIYSERETEEMQEEAADQQAQQQQAQMMSEQMGKVDPNTAPEEGSIAQSMAEESEGGIA